MRSAIIVGGGVIGLFCAARLSQRGVRVTLFEAAAEDFDVHGPAASLAAAGMLAPISEGARETRAHPQFDALALASFDLWRTLSAGALWSDGVRFSGAAFIARDGAGAEALARKAAALGRKSAPLTPAQWKKRTGLEARFTHALLIEDEGVADPARVLSGLAMEARRHGAQLMFSHDVDAVGAGFAETFEAGRAEADVVVLAPGPWASARLAAAAPSLARVRPAKGHMLAAELDGTLDANVRAPGFYLARRGEREIVLGGDMIFDDYSRRADPKAVEALLAHAQAMFPGQVRARADAPPWAGVRPMSPDGAPMIGPDGDLIVACGHSRNGWLLAPITAEIVCAYVLGEAISPLWRAFGPDRFAV